MLEHDPRLAGLVAAVAAGGAVIFWLCRSDPREPPVISSGIPFVGHLINLLWEGAGYFSRLDTRYHLGLYTLPILGRKVYIVNSPQWAMAMHRCGGLHLNPIFLSALPQLGGLDKEAMSILQQNALNELGDGSGPLLETEAAIKAAFRHDADDLNGKFLQCYTPFINKLQSCMSDQTIPLWQWLRHAFSIASATVFYGPQAPFALEASLADDFWYFADRLTHVALVPSAVRGVAFRQTVQSHERVIEAMVKYFESEGERQASTIVQRRAQIDYRSGMTKKMHGRNEMSFLFAILINTVPVTFWLLSYAFSDQDLLRQLRAEVDNCVTSEPGKKTRILHVDRLKDYCSLLNSVMRETERFSATLNINRIVTEDTQIRNHGTGQSYLLKKGNLVTVAANAIHFQSEVFGEDSAVFNPSRFLPTVEKAGKGKAADPAAAFRDPDGTVHAGAFRTFGGGDNVCPGRFFAATEMLTVVGLMIAGFDIQMPDGSPYRPPPYEKIKVVAGAHHPAHDVQVRIKRRDGLENVDWSCVM